VLMYSFAMLDPVKMVEFAQGMRRGQEASILNLAGTRGITELVGSGITEFPTAGTPADIMAEIEDVRETALARYQQQLANLFPSAFETYFDHLDGAIDMAQMIVWDVMEDFSIRIELPSELLFAPGSATLTAAAIAYIREEVAPVISAAFMMGDTIIIEGHTDNVPHGGGHNFRDNWELSFGRARSVMNIVQRYTGLPGMAFRPMGMGEYHPVDPMADNDSPENRALNRRVVIVVEASPLTDPLQRFLFAENGVNYGINGAEDYTHYEDETEDDDETEILDDE